MERLAALRAPVERELVRLDPVVAFLAVDDDFAAVDDDFVAVDDFLAVDDAFAGSFCVSAAFSCRSP